LAGFWELKERENKVQISKSVKKEKRKEEEEEEEEERTHHREASSCFHLRGS